MCPTPRSAYGFSKLTGEVFTVAAHEEHGAPVHDLQAVQRLRAGEIPDDEPASRTSSPT